MIIITSFITYNFIDIGLSFQNKSKQLVILFNKLCDLEDNTNKIITCLIDYNLILHNSYSTISRIYVRNHDSLKGAWNIRKEEVLNKISVGQISQTINREYKLLFEKSLHFDHSLIIGSYATQIEVAGKSDLDILLVFKRDNLDLITPSAFYQTVYAKLKLLYRGNLKESYPSFIIQNFNDLTIEITPCFIKDDQTFQIVDQDNKWVDIQPQKMNDHFHDFDEKSGGRFYKILKMIKEWRYEKKIQIVQSFYIQTLLYNVMMEHYGKSEEQILFHFYKRLKILDEIKNPISASLIMRIKS